ncbi:MAG: zf-HC2 domain-containing protein [Elusimicrobiota bacterium]|jgi:anti-sigma factor RsiW
MECKGVLELLSAYADRETTLSETRLVEEHVAGCAACGRRLAVLARTKEVFSSMAVPAAPRELKESLLREAGRFSARKEASHDGLLGRWRWAWRNLMLPRYGFAFGLAAFLIVGLWFERSGSSASEEPVPLDLMLSAHRQSAEDGATTALGSGPAAEDLRAGAGEDAGE